MKQVIFFLAATLCFCNCNNTTNSAGEAEQIKMKLLKLAGFDKMDKGFTFEYMLQGDSEVSMLNLVPGTKIITLEGDEINKGKLLNTFSMPDGKQYKTLLMKKGAAYVSRIVSIDGNIFEEHVYLGSVFTGGPDGETPPLLCINDCSDRCIQSCLDYYRRSIFPALQDSATRTCKTLYYRFACPLNAQGCHSDYLQVFIPQNRNCFDHVDDPGSIVARKMAGGLAIKNRGEQK